MATPIYASPIVDPQTDINNLNTVYTSEHLTENYNTFFNEKTEKERLDYMPEGYEDQIDFDPFQSDYGLDFKSTLESEGFVNYVKSNPVRAAAQASGPTVTAGGNVLSTGELRRRKAGPPEGRVVYRDEVLPFYPGKGEEDEGSVFDYWKSIPNISSFSEGLKGTIYGVTQPKEAAAAAAPVAQAPAEERPLFSPGGHQSGIGVPSTSKGSLTASQKAISKMSVEGLAIHDSITAMLGLPKATPVGPGIGEGTGAADGVAGGIGPTGVGDIGSVANAAANAANAAAAAPDPPTPPGNIGQHSGEAAGPFAKGGKITTQMNNLQSGGEVTVTGSDENTMKIIRDLQSKKGSNVQVLKDDGKLVGAIDMNDPSRHFIIDMDDFDSKLGIIQPHEMAMAADPRTAGQLGYKRNWDARMQKLLEIQEGQIEKEKFERVRKYPDIPSRQPVVSEPAPDGREGYRSSYDVGVAESIVEDNLQHPLHQPGQVEKESVPPPLAKLRQTAEPVEPRTSPIPKVELVPYVETKEPVPYVETAQQAYERLMRERLETESGWTPPPTSGVGPYPIRRAEPFVDSGPSPIKLVETVLGHPAPEDYFNEIVRPLEFNTEYYNSKKHFNEKRDQYIGYLDSIQEKEKQDAEEKGEVYTPTFTTFGPGFTIPEDYVGVGMSKEDVEKGALRKWKYAIESSKRLLENDDHPSTMVLAEMIYQMGEERVVLFKDMLAALIARNGKQAKKHALYNKDGSKTKWHSQMENSGRAVVVADRLEESLSSDKNLQAGGQVPQINQSGFIEGPGSPVSDSIPMQAEADSFIVNAPAVQMAGGPNKLNAMVQKTNPKKGTKTPTSPQSINVSNGEYKIGKQDAQKIGYNKLNKMNNAGKPFVDQIDQKGYAEGGVPLPVRKPMQVTFGDKTMQVTDEEIKGLAKLLYLEDTRMVIPEDVLGVVINRMNIALNSKKGKDEFVGDTAINFMNLMAKPHAFEPVSMNAVRNGALYFDKDNQHKIDTLQKNNSEILNNLEQVIRNTFNEVNSKTYNNPVGKSLWFQNVEGSDRFDKPSNLTENVNIGYFNTHSIRHIPQEKGKDKVVEFYEVNPDKEKVIASKKLNFDAAYDRGFYNKVREFNYDTSIPVDKPDTAFVTSMPQDNIPDVKTTDMPQPEINIERSLPRTEEDIIRGAFVQQEPRSPM